MNPEFEKCLDKRKIKEFSRGKKFEGLQKAKILRENADYYDEWSKIGAETILNLAEEFLNKSKQLVNSQLNTKHS